jgi:hypothetical protein
VFHLSINCRWQLTKTYNYNNGDEIIIYKDLETKKSN